VGNIRKIALLQVFFDNKWNLMKMCNDIFVTYSFKIARIRFFA